MCGVTRLSVTLAVILFELTGSLEHVLPFSMGVLIAKWTADALEPLSIYDLLTDMNAYPYLDAKVRPIFDSDLGDLVNEPNPNRYIDVTASALVPAKRLRFQLEYLHMAGEIDGGLPILRHDVLVGLIPGPDLEFALDLLESEEEGVMCLMDARAERKGRGENRRPSSAASGMLVDTTVEDDDRDTVMGDTSLMSESDGGRPSTASTERTEGTERTTTARNDTNNANPTAQEDDTTAAEEEPSDDDAADDEEAPDLTDFTRYIDPSPVSLDITSPMDLVFECFSKLGLRYICVTHEGKYAGMVHKKTFVRFVKEVQDRERAGRRGGGLWGGSGKSG
jgi:chloride channel 3/4/5